MDTLTVILVPNHETVPPKQQEKETIPRTSALFSNEPNDQQILSADQIWHPPVLFSEESDDQQIQSPDSFWHPPVLDLTTLTEKKVMNLCIQCLQAPKYVEPDGRIHEYCGKGCAIS